VVTNGVGVLVNRTQGEVGNMCHVDCANQGICDYNTGTCHCFDGQYGTDCSLQVQLAVKYSNPDGIYSAQPMQPEAMAQAMQQYSDATAGFDTFSDYV
jgi:hypothetical protein